MNRIVLIISILVSASFTSFANGDIISLVVSGEGETKTEAINNTLKQALEQTYGTFVSADDVIVNDELVKEEVVSISSGKIISYKELSSAQLDNGLYSVTLQAEISLKSLVNYAKSKGSKCEFAGATFGANLKLAMINKDNSKVAYSHLIQQLEILSKDLYDYSIVATDPKITGEVTFKVNACGNSNSSEVGKKVYETLMAISVGKEEAKELAGMGIELYPYSLNYFSASDVSLHSYSHHHWGNGLRLDGSDDCVRYFYFELNNDLNKYLCPKQELSIVDNTGKDYKIVSSMVGKTYFLDPANCGSYTMSRNSNDVTGIEQGVIKYSSLSSFGIHRNAIVILLKDAEVNSVLYTITKKITIPVEHLTTISSFEIR